MHDFLIKIDSHYYYRMFRPVFVITAYILSERESLIQIFNFVVVNLISHPPTTIAQQTPPSTSPDDQFGRTHDAPFGRQRDQG